MTEQGPRRAFAERQPVRSGALRDAHAFDRAVLVWTAIAAGLGFIMGAFLGYFVKATGGPGWVTVLCPFLGAAFVAGLLRLVLRGGAATAGTIYNPSGETTPHRKEYSYAESLVARGLYDDAVTAFELAVAEDPTDPWPYLRVARIYRDHLGCFEDAARWFRRAFREAGRAPSLARKELVELYVHRMNAPGKAASELARMAEELAGTPEGEWAAAELRHVKELLARG